MKAIFIILILFTFECARSTSDIPWECRTQLTPANTDASFSFWRELQSISASKTTVDIPELPEAGVLLQTLLDNPEILSELHGKKQEDVQYIATEAGIVPRPNNTPSELKERDIEFDNGGSIQNITFRAVPDLDSVQIKLNAFSSLGFVGHRMLEFKRNMREGRRYPEIADLTLEFNDRPNELMRINVADLEASFVSAVIHYAPQILNAYGLRGAKWLSDLTARIEILETQVKFFYRIIFSKNQNFSLCYPQMASHQIVL